MNPISVIVAVFSVIGATDLLLGNRLGLGAEFERGFKLLGTMALSMIGMITISPVIANVLDPCFTVVYERFNIDPSIIPASLFANDMGGATLAKEVARNGNVGMFNALIISSMMGCTVSFTIPLALGCVKKERQRELMLGIMCGIVTIPTGAFVAGLFSGLSIQQLLVDLLPLLIFGVVLSIGLLTIPGICVRLFTSLSIVIKMMITIGLILGITKFLVGIEMIQGIEDIEYGASICLNAAIVMSGMFPLIALLKNILSKFLDRIGQKLQISEVSTMGLLATLATNVTTFEMMNEMDSKGAVLNAAFGVSASFTFAGHLAFTLAFDPNYLSEMIIAKLISGFTALVFACVVVKNTDL